MTEFLADGIALGQRVRYVATGRVEQHMEMLRGLARLGGGRRDAVQAVSLEAMYRTGAVVEPAAQVRAYAAATDEAVADGFTGLRVAADATPLAREPEQLEAFTRYEHLVDRYMTRRPFAAMCAYDSAELGATAVTQLACMHPVATVDSTPFRLHATADADAALSGELDMASRTVFPVALERIGAGTHDGELVVDASGLTFIDQHSLLALDGFARRRGVTVVLRDGWPGAVRLIEILEIRHVRVERRT